MVLAQDVDVGSEVGLPHEMTPFLLPKEVDAKGGVTSVKQDTLVKQTNTLRVQFDKSPSPVPP